MSEKNALDYPQSRYVSFVDSIPLFFRNYLKFEGRSSRGAFWWWMLASVLINVGLALLDGMIVGWEQDNGPLGMLFSLITLIPSLALNVRRLHDVGRSGWWLLLAVTIIGILLLFYWAVLPGQRRRNRFGPDHETGRGDYHEELATTFS
ncbi:DUF805 domain-containing protein [Parvularcula dongshanensis]|uniref:Uncharacterized membrane protein YhaH (DUF805 family) n=1 Tax=Parvularcula dongshanensis TaxID=1173995 RepID=A0A840I3C4_9PROT|nr:DUF805 domain-containing protein [Parvularcula dongshanensis]MBB4658773.1 uncharacterized membrane protein YhaH (DUF805 family) [Parvularcula dongshanensis]